MDKGVRGKGRGCLSAWEVGVAISGKRCLTVTCFQGQGLGFIPIFSAALSADLDKKRGYWGSSVRATRTGSYALCSRPHVTLGHMPGVRNFLKRFPFPIKKVIHYVG